MTTRQGGWQSPEQWTASDWAVLAWRAAEACEVECGPGRAVKLRLLRQLGQAARAAEAAQRACETGDDPDGSLAAKRCRARSEALSLLADIRELGDLLVSLAGPFWANRSEPDAERGCLARALGYALRVSPEEGHLEVASGLSGVEDAVRERARAHFARLAREEEADREQDAREQGGII